MRRQKTAEKMRREKIIQEIIDPTASKERKAALAFRYMEENKRLDLQLAQKKKDKEFTGVPDMSKTLKSTKKYIHYHPGKWLVFQNKEIWNCCASEARESRGCKFKIIDKMKWQLDV